MLQIIGLLGCLYLLVKGLEITTSNAHRDTNGKMHGLAVVNVSLAFVGAVLFALMLVGQGEVMSNMTGSSLSSTSYSPPASYNVGSGDAMSEAQAASEEARKAAEEAAAAASEAASKM